MDLTEKIERSLDIITDLNIVSSYDLTDTLDVILFAKRENERKIRNHKILEMLRKDRTKAHLFDLEKANKIIDLILNEYSLTVETIKSKSRVKPLPEARFICYELIKYNTELSLKSIGKIFSGRDHSTIINGLKAVSDWKHTDVEFRQKFLYLETLINLELEKVEPELETKI